MIMFQSLALPADHKYSSFSKSTIFWGVTVTLLKLDGYLKGTATTTNYYLLTLLSVLYCYKLQVIVNQQLLPVEAISK